MLDPRFAEQIIDAWTVAQTRNAVGLSERKLPPFNVIKEFIDIAFLATLRDEEGQQARFSVALVSEEELASPQNPRMLTPIQLELSSDFSAETLVKLAGAFEPELTTIVVTWKANKNSFSYWGIIFHAPGPNRFTEIPVGVDGGANFRPDYFTVISKGRAALTIARGRAQVGILQAGYFVAASPTPFTSYSLGKHVHAVIQSDPLFSTFGNQYWLYARDAIQQILSEASIRSHGGSIIFIPSNIPPNSGLYTSKYVVNGMYGLQATLQKCIEAEGANRGNQIESLQANMLMSIAYRKIANETIQRIAKLSAIDGALLITFNFKVVAFGATLTPPPSTLLPVTGPDGYGHSPANSVFEINRYGTRHRSAFEFVSALPGSIAFVISQDGPVRAFRRENDTTVHVWPDCTSSMFI